MLDLSDMTSPLRVALSSAIVTHVRNHGTPADRERLARELAMHPFEERSHDLMVDTAIAYGISEEEVAAIATRHDSHLVPLTATHLCRTCGDERVIRVEQAGVERFARCPDCNTAPAAEPFDPKARR